MQPKKKKNSSSSAAPRRRKSAFDARLPSDDGHLALIAFEAEKLANLQTAASYSESEEKDLEIIEQADRLGHVINDAMAQNEASHVSPSSHQIKFLRRSAYAEMLKKGLCPLVPPTSTDEPVASSVLSEEQHVYDASCIDSAEQQMKSFATDLLKSFTPGSAVTSNEWLHEARDSNGFRDVYMKMLQLRPVTDKTKPRDPGRKRVKGITHDPDTDSESENDEELSAIDLTIPLLNENGESPRYQSLEERKRDRRLGDPMDNLFFGEIDGYANLMAARFLVKYIVLGVYIREDFGVKGKLVPSPDLETTLRPWQLEGAELLRHMLNSPLRGAVLGDGMGLGKTLTSIVTTLRDRDEPYEGPVLVVAPKSVQSTWLDELAFHFKAMRGPSVFVLQDRKIPAAEIFSKQYDFILISYNWLTNANQDVEFARSTGNLFVYTGSDWHQTLGDNVLPLRYQRPWRPHFPLSAEVMDIFGITIPILVLDEAHKVKNIDAESHAATLNLKYSKLLAVTGTAFPNKWFDIYGLIELLPGNPFQCFKHFVKCFSTLVNGRASNTCEMGELLAFLDAFIVARPQSVMDLQGLEEHVVEAPLDPQRTIVIAILADEFYRLSRMNSDKDPDEDSMAAMAKAVEAETLSVSELLSREDRKQDAKAVTAFNEWLQKEGIVLESINPDHLLKWVQRPGPRVPMKYKRGAKETQTPSVPDGDDPDDKDFDPTNPNAIDDDEAEAEDEEYFQEQTKGRRGPRRQVWLDRLSKAEPEEFVHEPRVKAVTSTVADILSRSSKAKILVFSKYLTVLDIFDRALQEAEKDNALRPRILRFDGTMSQEKRDVVRHEVQDISNETACVILITAGAGGVGLTLTGANHVIMAEYWWTKAEELQAISRCYRQGQEKAVHVWRVRSNNSAMEAYVQFTAEAKAKVTGEIAESLVREDSWLSLVTPDTKSTFFVYKAMLGLLPFPKFTHQADYPPMDD